jgi:hypothetical protein
MKVNVPETVVWQDVGGEIVLLELKAGEYYRLNEVGSEMWRALYDHSDVADAYERLREMYEPAVAGENLRADLVEFVERLIGARLLTTS